MYDIERLLDTQILSMKRNRPVVVFSEPDDPRVLEAAFSLARFVRPVFPTSEAAIRETAGRDLPHIDRNRVEFALSESAFVDISDRADLQGEFARECLGSGSFPREAPDVDAALAYVSEPARFGIFAVACGHADVVVGGASHEPKDFFRPLLKVLANRQVVTEAGVFVLPDEHPERIFPHNIVVFGDVGVNTNMTPEILADVAVGTCCIARDLFPEDVLPEINGAIISYSNSGSDEGSSPELVRRALDLVPSVLEERVSKGGRYKTIHIAGEMKVNVVLSQRSAAYYSLGHEKKEWQGGTNVIICPNLDMGNMLFNLYAVRFPDAKKFPVIFGVSFRAVDLAMDCTPEDVRLAVKASVLRLHRFGQWTRTPRDTFFKRYRILAVNPGSTSTKIGLFEGDEEMLSTELQHPAAELAQFEGRGITAQFAFRKGAIEKYMEENGVDVETLDAISARGGILRPIPHGTYKVEQPMLDDLLSGTISEHASNLGALIASELAAGRPTATFIVDPVVVDEAPERVKISGVKALRRRVLSHALNQIASARRFAEENETFYEKVNVVVAHMGGGITVGAHKKGVYIDVNNGLDGEGPFSPQRSGSLPVGQLIEMCFSGEYSKADLKKLNKGRGGLIDLLGTADLREVVRRVDGGDAEAGAVFEAMAYQIAKAVAALVPAFDGEKIDRIILTGGMARSRKLVERIEFYVSAMGCGVTVYPGENEMLALAKGALRVLSGRETARSYPPDEARGPASTEFFPAR